MNPQQRSRHQKTDPGNECVFKCVVKNVWWILFSKYHLISSMWSSLLVKYQNAPLSFSPYVLPHGLLCSSVSSSIRFQTSHIFFSVSDFLIFSTSGLSHSIQGQKLHSLFRILTEKSSFFIFSDIFRCMKSHKLWIQWSPCCVDAISIPFCYNKLL